MGRAKLSFVENDKKKLGLVENGRNLLEFVAKDENSLRSENGGKSNKLF